ncbi:MAG: AbrB/MazE/SpoVT family DNA-binding domain-containing protein [Promethearchaeota archaeon]
MKEKEVTVTNQGMITIPAPFRKVYDIKDGDKVLIVEDEGTLKIIPLKSIEEIKRSSYDAKSMLAQMKRSKEELTIYKY